MYALVLDQSGIKIDKNYPSPECPSGYARLLVLKAGICSTDLQIIDGLYAFKGILGHEFVATVIEENCNFNSNIFPGDVVVGEINIACKRCSRCKQGLEKHCSNRSVAGIRGHDGAFAEEIVLPVENLHRVARNIDTSTLVLTEPLAAVFDILDKVDITPQSAVAVIGDGKIAQLACRVLHQYTSHLTVIGKHQDKLARLPMSIHRQLVGEQIGTDYDIVIECSGSTSGFHSALSIVRPMGKIVLKSTYRKQLSFQVHDLVVNEIEIIGSRCGNFRAALDYLAIHSNSVELLQLIDAEFDLSDAVDAVEYAKRPNTMKVVLNMDNPVYGDARDP